MSIDSEKVAEIIKNADLYDLIRISLETSECRLRGVDEYIKKSSNKQANTTQQLYSLADVASAISAIEKDVVYHESDVMTPIKRSISDYVELTPGEFKIIETPKTRNGH